MSLLTLIQAAEYLDRREREAEHGYATTSLPPPASLALMPVNSTQHPQSAAVPVLKANNNSTSNSTSCLTAVELTPPPALSIVPSSSSSSSTCAGELIQNSIAAQLPVSSRSGGRPNNQPQHYSPLTVVSPCSSPVQGSFSSSSSSPTNITITNNTTRGTKKPQGGSRSSHNELEKNRRAHLRGCLESLKDLVPLGSDSSRHTTLGLLNKAKHFIKNLEDKDRKSQTHKETLAREQRYLRRRLELLSCQMDAIHKRRSISESSSSTVSSIQSSTSESDEHDGVDVIGYGGLSDDDHSSVRSTGSDGGMTVTTWKQLTIGETI